MYKESGHRYSGTCTALNQQINDLRGLIRVAESNQKLREEYKKKKDTHDGNIKLCNQVLEFTKPVIATTEKYLADRKEESLQNLNNALRMAGDIVQDAMSGIKISIDKESATIVDEDGGIVQAMEGGGYRQISSMFLRHAILSMTPDYLHTLILDENFALVNDENSATLSSYLQLMSQTTQIISIEQKGSVYGNVDHICYTFKKADKVSTAERTEHIASEVG